MSAGLLLAVALLGLASVVTPGVAAPTVAAEIEDTQDKGVAHAERVLNPIAKILADSALYEIVSQASKSSPKHAGFEVWENTLNNPAQRVKIEQLVKAELDRKDGAFGKQVRASARACACACACTDAVRARHEFTRLHAHAHVCTSMHGTYDRTVHAHTSNACSHSGAHARAYEADVHARDHAPTSPCTHAPPAGGNALHE